MNYHDRGMSNTIVLRFPYQGKGRNFARKQYIGLVTLGKVSDMRKGKRMMNQLKWMMGTVILLGFSTVEFSACGSRQSQPSGQGETLNGTIAVSGAFALYPLAVKWADAFEKLHPDVNIDLSAGGAGKGITDVLADQVDLGMVSRELKPAEVQQGALAFAVAGDAVVPTMNARNPVYRKLWQKGLSVETARGLWITGRIRTWGQVAGTSNATQVDVYTRSDACGAAETFAKWLGHKQEDLKGTGIYGDPGVAQQVMRDPYGIGMNNIGYTYDDRTQRLNPGLAIVPIDVNGNGKLDVNERFYATKSQLIRAIGEGKYPAPPARNLYLVTKGKPTNPVVVAFLKFILTKGQKENVPAGYIPLDKGRQQRQLAVLK